MNKAILMSIQPKWLVKILNGDKSAELRKRFPKDYRGWIYLYCTKDKKLQWVNGCLPIAWGQGERNERLLDKTMNGKVVARVWVDDVDVGTKLCDGSGYVYLPQTSLWLTNEEIMQYANNSATLAVIYFSKLEIFDKPKELSDFLQFYGGEESFYELKRAPQSWQYVYVEEETI